MHNYNAQCVEFSGYWRESGIVRNFSQALKYLGNFYKIKPLVPNKLLNQETRSLLIYICKNLFFYVNVCNVKQIIKYR